MVLSTHYNYEAYWRPYAFPEDESHLASDEELREHFNTQILKKDTPIPAAGIPILSDGEEVTFDIENSMNIIFGATGSKKSRVLVSPYICSCALAATGSVTAQIESAISSSFGCSRGFLLPSVRTLRLDGTGSLSAGTPDTMS